MADAKESLWTGKFHAPSATARAPYGDPLADPFKPKPDAGRAGQVERLPQILGPLHAEQERVRTIFEKGSGKPPRTSTALRIFIGGGLDEQSGRNMVSQYERYRSEVDGPASYYSHAQVPEIAEAIRQATAKGVPVDIIGHSYGGVAGFDAIVQAGDRGRVRNFITADPVGRYADSSERPRTVENWVNITADPSEPNRSDWIARAGGKAPLDTPNIQQRAWWEVLPLTHEPRRVPTNYADENFIVDRNHEDLAAMMRAADVPRLLMRGDSLSDSLDTPDWMKGRNAQVGGVR